MDIINVEHRDMKVKAKHLRRMGLVPCTVYGGSLPESVSITMEVQTANAMYRHKRVGSRVSLKLDGAVLPAQIKELDLLAEIYPATTVCLAPKPPPMRGFST